MLPEIEGKQVLLSARAQYTLWRLLRQTAQTIDDMFQKSLSMPSDSGAELRRRLIGLKEEVIRTAQSLYGANETALNMGVQPALKSEWLLVEYPEEERLTAGAGAGLLASPGFWALFGIVIIAVAIVTTGWLVSKIIRNMSQADLLSKSIDKFIEIGRPDLIPQLLHSMPEFAGTEKKFPWGTVIGTGVAIIAGLLLFNWTLKKLEK